MFDVRSEKPWEFTIIENVVLEDKSLTIYEKMTYIMLCKFSNRDRSRSVFPSHDTLAESVGCSRRTVITVLSALETRRYIKVEPQFKGNGGQSSNIYVLLPLDQVVPPVQEMHTPCAGDAHPPVQEMHTNKNKVNENKINKNKKDLNIAAKTAVPSNRPSNTLFDLPSTPVQLSRIDQARASGDWRKVTTSDFVQYFVDRQNEMFPVQINLPKSKDGNYQVSMFRKNLIERHQIAQDSICDVIEQILDTYKRTETKAAYRDSFDLSTFKHEWRIDQLMDERDRAAQYGSNRKRTEYAPDPNREIF